MDNVTIIPDHKLMMLPCNTPDEAFFICACLNSSILAFVVKSYAVETSISTHLFKYVKLPLFDFSNDIHSELSRLSLLCHEKRAAGIDVTDLEEQIDELTAEMWGLTKEELNVIQDTLEELR